jgi:hypothetical protein
MTVTTTERFWGAGNRKLSPLSPNPKITLDNSTICAIRIFLDNYVWSAGA